MGDVEDPLTELVVCVGDVLATELDGSVGVEALEDEAGL